MREKLVASLKLIVEETGLPILEDSLRLNAFLRDLHSDQPGAISALVEVMESGVLQQLRRLQWESELHAMADLLVSQSGITPGMADWAVQSWFQILPASARLREEKERFEKPQKGWVGSIEDILGPCLCRNIES